jgi:UDPglucose 6-dehydrogenase
MHVAVIGSGYVGLVAGACLAETGNDVCCVDNDADKVARLQRNEIPIYEPGLEPMVERNQDEGRLTFTTDIASAVKSARVIFIAVGTPPGEDGSADLQHVLGVAREIGRHMNEPKIVVTKSTVPVGTAEKVRAAIRSQTDIPFAVCSNPEFLKEGAAIDDFMRPDRVVIGVDDEEAKAVMGELYAPFTRQGGNRILFMDIASAEVTKYAANAMLATRISFMNQMALFCELVGADVNNVRLGIGSDQRIGRAFLYPGPGYGGSCFPKDVKAIIRTADDLGLSLDVLKAVEAVNECQKLVVLQKVPRVQGGDGRHAREPDDSAGGRVARRGRAGAGARPESGRLGPCHLRRPRDVRGRPVQRRARGGRPARDDRVAGLPQSRLRAHPEAAPPAAARGRTQSL